MATETEKLVYIIEVQDNASKPFGKVSLNMGKMVEGIGKTVENMGKAIVDFARESAQAAADYESSLALARRTMVLTKEETDALGRSLQLLALDMSEAGLQGAVSANELARIAGIAGTMGFSFRDDAEGLKIFTETIAKTAIAFEQSAESTASSLGIISNMFDIPIEKTTELAGAIAGLADNTKGTAGNLINFATRIGPVFSEMGGNINQALALGSTLRDSGITMEVAGTAMVQLMTNMQTEYTKFEQVLSAGGLAKGMLEMKLRAGDAMGAITLVAQSLDNISKYDKLAATEAMKDLGLRGFRSLSVLQALVSEFPKYQQKLELIADPLKNAQTLQEKYTASIDNMNSRITSFKNAFTIVKQVIGKELSDAIERTMERSLNPFMARFAEWVQNSPAVYKVTKSLGEIIELLGSKLVKAGESFMAWIEGLNQMTGSRNAAMELDKAFRNIQPTLDKLKQKAIDTFNSIKTNIKTAWEWWLVNGPKIVEVVEDVTYTLGEMMALVKDSKQIFKDFGEGFWNDVAKPFIELDKWWVKFNNNITDTTRKLTGQLKQIADEGKKTEDVLTGNSLFPDWAMWAMQVSEDMDDLTERMVSMAQTANVSTTELNSVMNQTGQDLADLTTKLSIFEEDQLKMLSDNLGGGMLRMTQQQLASTLQVFETVKAASDSLAGQSASALQQISARVRELTLTDPAYAALAGASSLANAAAANRAEQSSVQDQFAAQPAKPTWLTAPGAALAPAQNKPQTLQANLVMDGAVISRFTSTITQEQEKAGTYRYGTYEYRKTWG